jgi:DNA-binding transcriptional LysR family regulator
VTTTVGLGSNWLTPRLSEFIELYPDINVQLMLQDTELDLGMREADVAIRLRKPVQAELIQRKLFTVHFHIYASPGYITEHGAPVTIEELDDHRFVSFGVMTPPYLKHINWLENHGRKGGKPREPILSINSVDGIKRAAQNGIGIAALPDYIVRDESKAGLVRILTDVETPSFDTYFVYAEEIRNSARMIVFRDFLLGKARQWSF